MNLRIKHHFLQGFNEGWAMFWSPFTGLFREVKKVWSAHIGATSNHKGHSCNLGSN